MGNGEGFTTDDFIVCTIHLIVKMIKYRRLRWAEDIARMGESKLAFKILTIKHTRKRALGRPTH